MAAQDTLMAGIFAGRYSIERELGRGATAYVYLARDQRHGTPVAIKLLRLDVSQTIGTERFLKEIRMSAGLHHPHILPVLDSGEHDGQLFFVLPHADGGTLRDRLLAEKQLPVVEALAIARTLAAALDHAHARGIIHRDVKPENILFTGGQACLADFGIARALDPDNADSTTSTGIVRGTPAYMSPEQASGESVLDGRTDLYSLACVVYEMLAGMRAFDGPTAQSVIAMRLTEAARSVRVYRPSLPPAMDRVFAQAFAISPADRFQSGAELMQALDRAMISPPSAPPARWNRWKIAAAVLGVGAVAAGAAVFIPRPGATDTGIPEGDPRRVAVMYLDNLTPTEMPLHVADGITEDLIDQLGGVRVLQVTSTYGVRQYRNVAVGVDSIRRALKVGTIVTGSIARSGDSVRLNFRLVDASSGQQLASSPLVVPWAEVAALGTNLAERVAFTLRQHIGDRVGLSENRATTRSAEAWELAQQASAAVRQSMATFSVPLLLEADSLYARAARKDPTWELPWIRRGNIAKMLAVRSRPPDGTDSLAFRALTPVQRRWLWYANASALADSALKRAPRSAKGLGLRGEMRYMMSLGRSSPDSLLDLAERDLKAALDVRPDAAGAWTTLASMLLTRQRFAEAADAAKRGYDADPYFESRAALSTAFFTSLFAQRFGEARRWCRIGKDHYAEDPRFVECELTLLGWEGTTQEQFRAAERELFAIERADSLGLVADTRAYRQLMVAAIAARAGLPDSARQILRAVRASVPVDSVPQNTAIPESYVWLLVNERDSTIAILRRYVAEAPHALLGVQKHPWFAAVRGDPRFAALGRAAK